MPAKKATSASETSSLLPVGGKAPAFSLKNAAGKTVKLSDFKGKKVVLYFYPKDLTPGCTTEACGFRDDYSLLQQHGVEVIGVSADEVASHQKFVEKHSLPFPLLADSEGQVAGAYGVVRNLGVIKLAKRESFLIDPEGRIVKHYTSVDPKTHSAQVLADLKQLMAAKG